jgi:hypothetical protein
VYVVGKGARLAKPVQTASFDEVSQRGAVATISRMVAISFLAGMIIERLRSAAFIVVEKVISAS